MPLKVSDSSAFGRQHRAAISLLANIPSKRTCQSAAIDPHWCMCTYTEHVDVTSIDVIMTAKWVVEHINNRLKPVQDHCKVLQFNRLLSAEYVIPNDVVSIRLIMYTRVI